MKITKFEVSNTSELSIDYNGCNYLVIYGKHINGGFFSIPNWGVGGELSDSLHDVFWNTKSLERALGNYDAANMIARCIAKDWKDNLISVEK